MPRTEKQQRIDREIAEIASRQYGLIEAWQLAELMNHASIRQREQADRLHRRFRGVYSVGHEVLPQEGRWLAAVLASGPTAALSHRSAAHHLGLIDKSPEWFTEVTANTRGRRAQRGIRLYETTRLDFQFTACEGIRTTTAARTIADLAAVSTQRAVEKAIGRAEVKRLLTAKDLLDAARYRKGAPMIRKIIGDPTVTETLSSMEDDFLALVARFGLPTPKSEQEGCGRESRLSLGTSETDRRNRRR